MGELIRQMASYGVIGLLCSSLDAALFAALVGNLSVDPLVANCVSVSLGATISFFLNRAFTFKVADKVLRRYVTFFCVAMAGLLLSELMLITGAKFGIDAFVIKIVSIFVVAALQFVLNKAVSFKSE